MRVAVVIPTIDGREDHLERCVAAYARTAPESTVVVKHGYPSCGEAWIAGARDAGEFDYLHLSADDLEPHDGWLDVAIETVECGYIPAPLVYLSDGTLQSAGLAGFGCYTGPHDDWQIVDGTTVPFVTRAMWERIGMVPIHYCTDLWISAKGREHGWQTVIRTGMRFTHYNAEAGRLLTAAADTHEFLRRLQGAA